MYIAMNRFFVRQGFEESFEKRWVERKRGLAETPGFVRFQLLKQDFLKNDGPAEKGTEFISYSQWIDRKHFEGWMQGSVPGGGAPAAHANKDPLSPETFLRPPEFRAYEKVLDEGHGHRTDFRSSFLDHKVEALFADEKAAQKQIMAKSNEAGLPPINIGALEGRILEVLLRSIGAKRGVELGTLGAYSTTWLARALPPDGHLVTIEKDPKHAALARNNLVAAQAAGVFSCKVEVLEGAGVEVLKTLENLKDLDFVFIDADKAGYPDYIKWAMPRLRKGGLLLCDNAYIWGGMHYFEKSVDEVTYPPAGRLDSFSRNEFKAMSESWRLMFPSKDFVSLVLPTGEGLALALKITP